MTLKQILFFVISFILFLVTGSCGKTEEVTVQQISGSFITPLFGDSVLPGRIIDIDRTGDRYYVIDDRSMIFSLDANLKMLRFRDVNGRGPGEVGRGSAIRVNNRGIWVFDSEGLKFVLFNDFLDFINEFQTSEIFPHLGFSFLIKDNWIYTADNSTDDLVSVFDTGSEEHPDSGNGSPLAGIGSDLSFFESTSRSRSRDNLYDIHKHKEDIVLVNRFNPVIMVLSIRHGSYEVVYQYSFEDIIYFKDVIQNNKEFHRHKENVYSWKTLVRDSGIYNNKLVLLISTEKDGDEFSNHILIVDLEDKNFVPKKIYQLSLEDGEMPWIRMFSITEEGNLLCVTSDFSEFIIYNIHLNE